MSILPTILAPFATMLLHTLENELIKHEPDIQKAMLDEAQKVLNMVFEKFNEKVKE